MFWTTWICKKYAENILLGVGVEAIVINLGWNFFNENAFYRITFSQGHPWIGLHSPVEKETVRLWESKERSS